MTYFPINVFSNIMEFCDTTQKDRYNKVVKQLDQLVQDSHDYIEKYGDDWEDMGCKPFDEFKEGKKIILPTEKYCSDILEIGPVFMLILWNRKWTDWKDYDYYSQHIDYDNINLSNLMNNPYGIYPRSHQNGFN